MVVRPSSSGTARVRCARRCVAGARWNSPNTGACRAARALLAAAGFSLLNPHAYLDTVVLLGSIGSQRAENLRPLFAAGAITASIVWFLLLGYSAACWHRSSPNRWRGACWMRWWR